MDSDDLNERVRKCAEQYGIKLDYYYEYQEVCKFLKRDRKTVFGYRKKGHLPHSLQGEKMVWRGWDIARFIVGNRPSTHDPPDAPVDGNPPQMGGNGMHDLAKRTFKKDD